jgi:hypothetical protein
MHNRQWQMYGANLSAGMGYLLGRSQRHMAIGAAIGTMGYYPSTKLAWGTTGSEGAAHPTLEDVLRCNGEGRGGAVALYQAIHKRLARFVDSSGKPQIIPVEDVELIADGVLYFSQADIHNKYEADSEGSVFVGAANLFRNSEEYHDKVIGMRPHPLCPDPSGTLYWAMQLRGGMTADGLPPHYIALDRLKKHEEWPGEHKDWPSQANFDLYRRYPSGRPGWGWYSVWQIVPKEKSRLKTVLGTFWIGFCKVQIFILDGEDECKNLMIGWRNQYNELVATDLLRQHVQAMAEAHGVADPASSYAGSPSPGDSASAADAGPWVTNDDGTDWQNSVSADGVSTTVPSGAACSSTSDADHLVLPAVAEGDEFQDAQSDEASLVAVAASAASGVAVAAPAAPVNETEAERRRRVVAEAAAARRGL